MDTIINTAITEICSHGTTGISLAKLWPLLHAPLSLSLKRDVFLGLTGVPGIRFKNRDGVEVLDVKLKPFEEIECLDLVVFADEGLRRCFVGLYEVKSEQLTDVQQRVLERLARARGTGVTQIQLSKEFGMPSNSFFCVAKKLESWGLIVRHPTIFRSKEATSDKKPNSIQTVHTNLIHLQRYAPPLSSHQRLEITKGNNNLEENHGDNVTESDDTLEECGQDDVLVKDFLPAIKAICDRLEQAKGKVLVVSDIKKELGYRTERGHKELKQAGLVEEFMANVNDDVETPTDSLINNKSQVQKKPVVCLKLLKKFSAKLFEHRTTDCESVNIASDEHIASQKRVKYTEQLVELPLEQQFVDMIDAEGSKGLLGIEACKRLGVGSRLFERSLIVPRFGLHRLEEMFNKGRAYRYWTPNNFCPTLSNSSSIRLEHDPAEAPSNLSPAENPSQGENRRKTTLEGYYSQSWLTEENTEKGVADEELQRGPQQDRGTNKTDSLVESPSSPVPKSFNVEQGKLYPSTSATRELLILERLEKEKIIIKFELQRWLESFHKDNRKMDRRTLERCLKKLQNEGRCKVMEFYIPGVANCGRHREIRAVIHPSVEGSTTELSEKVHEKLRFYETQNRNSVSSSERKFPVPVLHGIERIQMNSTSETGSSNLKAMRANGFVIERIVRAKLLHYFLWDYVNKLSNLKENASSPSNLDDSCLLFSLDTAMKAMPFGLYSQVVGLGLKWKGVTEKGKNDLLLSDFSDEEYQSLMGPQATSRLSRLTKILHLLKLIRLVADESPKNAVKNSHATVAYALDLKPYIEEPPSVNPLTGVFGSVDLRPYFRHDFVLSTTEALEKYWKTLENCYAAADPEAAVHSFPGSAAYEVLRVYYNNRQKRLNKTNGDIDVQVRSSNTKNDRHRAQRKRKRLSEGNSAKHAIANYHTEYLEAGEDEPTTVTPWELENDSKHSKDDFGVNKLLNQSLAVSNAVELYKIAILTDSKSAGIPNLPEETLRHYSHHDRMSAFDYLKQKKIMIVTESSFFLSRRFLRSVYLSQFPTNTGKRVAELASWIHENEKELMEGVLNLPSDLQCGDIYQLIALVSSGELSISPVLPYEGVGEAEDSRSSKRKYNDDDEYEYDNFCMSKKQKCNSMQESELYSRREKGFPGIHVSLSRKTILKSNAVEFFKDDDKNLLSSENDHFFATLGQKSSSIERSISKFTEDPSFESIAPSTVISCESIWEVMANYTTGKLLADSDRENTLVHPELIKSTFINIKKAGDQGLRMSEVSENIGIEGTIISEHLVNALELFGFIFKVNGYNHVHVVDSMYRAKYSLTSIPDSQDPETISSTNAQSIDSDKNVVEEGSDHDHEASFLNENDVHKVTVLNLPKDGPQHSDAIQTHDNIEGCGKKTETSVGGSKRNPNVDIAKVFHPILPWINRDGTINDVAYKGLTRRILGIVTQKPGILEDGILRHMNALNPQCCRKLLELMMLDKHLFVRKMCQRTSPATPPALLGSLIGNYTNKPRYACREHYFANPMSVVAL